MPKSAIEGNKICSGCNGDFPANKDNFHLQGKTPNGDVRYASKCKTCINKANKEKEAKSNSSTPSVKSNRAPWENMVIPENLPNNKPIDILPDEDDVTPPPSILKRMRDTPSKNDEEAFNRAMGESTLEIEPDNYDDDDDDQIMYLDNDEDDQIRYEYNERQKNAETYKSETELLIEKKHKLLALTKAYPDITKALKITTAKVFKMKTIEEVDNCMLNFKSSDTVNTAATLIRQGVIALSGLIEYVSNNVNNSLGWAGRFFRLQNYQHVVAGDPEIEVISREMGARYSDVIAPYCTPEFRLVMQLSKDALATHNYNVRVYGDSINVQPASVNEQPQPPPQPQPAAPPPRQDVVVTSKAYIGPPKPSEGATAGY